MCTFRICDTFVCGGGEFLESCQQSCFLLSEMVNVIFHNFRRGGIISYCNYCPQELHQSGGQNHGCFSLGCVPKSCRRVALERL